jgi:hypothetical protein
VSDHNESLSWYSVRCVFLTDSDVYEERITLWTTDAIDEAILKAQKEAAEYAGQIEAVFLGIAQAYKLEDAPSDGAEVFSLIRESDLEPDAYLNHFFDVGGEYQQRS